MAVSFRFTWALMDGYSAGAVYSNEGGFQASVAEWFVTNSISLLNVDYCHIHEEMAIIVDHQSSTVYRNWRMVGFMIGNNLPTKIYQTNRSLDMHEVAVDFLGECDQEWEGDDSGVTILQDETDHWDNGVPGDFVVKQDGLYSILRIAPVLEAIDHAVNFQHHRIGHD